MPELAVFRLEVAPSPRARRARQLAAILTAGACLAALLQAPSAWRSVALLASLAAGGLLFRPRQKDLPWRLNIGKDGTLMAASDGHDQAASGRYCASTYICLDTASGLRPVWPDSLPAEWRRLLVACSWPRASSADGAQATPDRRTK